MSDNAKEVPEATPRPWLVGGLDHIASIYSDVTLRTVADHLSIGDAELIVTAVNSYSALQAQNKLLREALLANSADVDGQRHVSSCGRHRGNMCTTPRKCEQLRQAIRGEKQDG